MVSIRWISAAAHAGPGTIILWIAASIFFLIPLAIAVGTLTVKYPGAGGMYVWARNDFGPFHGFLCFWTYWLGIAVLLSALAIAYMSMSAYALGPSLQHLTHSRTYVITASLTVIWLGLILNLVGITVGKWTENVAGIATWLLMIALVIMAILTYRKHGSATIIRTAQLIPQANWTTLSFWASICYAVSGFEVAGMMGGEVRDPARTMPRAAWLSSAFIATFYIASTIALLVLLPSTQIDELSGVPQAGVHASQILGIAWLPYVLVVLIIAAAIGQFGGQGSATARMPFAAGVDHLLPPVFGRLHSALEDSLRRHPRHGRHLHRAPRRLTTRRHHARRIRHPRLPHGHHRLPALLLHLLQRLESRQTHQRLHRRRRHRNRNRLLRRTHRRHSQRLALRTEDRSRNSRHHRLSMARLRTRKKDDCPSVLITIALLTNRHIVSTTRNSAFPLIIRAYASAAFSSGYVSIIARTPVNSAKRSVSSESAAVPAAQP